jgi:hypothetical protein
MDPTGSFSLDPGSYRDPGSFIFHLDGVVYRGLNESFLPHYDRLIHSGLLANLTGRGWLVPHVEQKFVTGMPDTVSKVIKPDRIHFVSYPCEWSFSQYQDAAKLLLNIEAEALECGMTLSDATAFNVQFQEGRPVWIDTGSFVIRDAGAPWRPYLQFCQHFLGPLALMAYRDPSVARMLRTWPDGLPLQLVSKLLPLRTWLRPGLFLHLHMHAAMSRRYELKPSPLRARARPVGLNSLRGLNGSLEGTLRGLRPQMKRTAWSGYYTEGVHGPEYLSAKEKLVVEYLEMSRPSTVWDLGANTAKFSRLAADRGAQTVAFEADPVCVDEAYRAVRADRRTNLLPLVMDLTNPTSAFGWNSVERRSWLDRGKPELVLCLALIHHLCLAHNLPFENLLALFQKLSRWLIIEFVPKEDPQSQRLLAYRDDIFPGYTPEEFERVFGSAFTIRRREVIPHSVRTLFLFEARPASRG